MAVFTCTSHLALLVSVIAASAAPTHLVMMVLDDVGWADVGYHGSDFPTPSIDRLATTEGVRLENYYVQQVCSPTRSALMTGRYPFHIGMQHPTTLLPGTTAALPMDVPTIAEVLKKAGYQTHAIGKWHLGYASWNNTPIGRGFNSYQGYLQGACDYYNKTVGISTLGGVHLPSAIQKAFLGFDFWRNKSPMWEEAPTASGQATYSLHAYQKEAKRILNAHDPQQPLFLYFAHQNIHEPLEYPPEPEYADNCKHVPHTKLGHDQSIDRNTLCAMMNRLDAAIQEFVDMLLAKGMWNNTLMWITTDNGGMMPPGIEGAAGSASSNYPLRSGKASLFQGGVRGVSFVTGGMVPKTARNSTVTGLLQHVDIPTTMAALAGTALSSSDGFNVWDSVANGAASPRTEVPLNVDTSLIAKAFGATAGKCCGGLGEFNGLIQGSWKLISGWSGAYDGWSSNDPYHVVQPNSSQNYQKVDGSKVWLFNIFSDPEERTNLASANPEKVRAMQRRLKELGDSKHGYVAPQQNLPHLRSFPKLHNGTWAPFLGAEEGDADQVII